MKRYRISNSELVELGKGINVVGPSIKPQTSPITTGRIIDSIFRFEGMDINVPGTDYTTSSPQGYIEALKNLSMDYIEALKDPRNRSAAGNLRFRGLTEEALRESAELLVQSENLNLSLLNKDVADQIYTNYRKSAIYIDETFKQLGMPSISLPSESPYKHFLRYLIDPYGGGVNPSEGIHPMILNLMRTSYNPSHDAASIEDFSTGRNRMRSPFSLARLHERSKKFFPEGVPSSLKEGSSKPMNHLGFDRGQTYTILTWDTETTGLTPDSQIREIALVRRTVRYDDSGKMVNVGQPQVISTRSKSFKSKLMDIAGYVDPEDKSSVPLSEAAFIAERGGKDKVDPAELAKFRAAFEDEGVEAVSEFKEILRYFTNEDNVLGLETGAGIKNLRIEGHNAEAFDLDKLISTMDRLPAFHKDPEGKALLKKFLNLRSQNSSYVLDTLDSAKITFGIQQAQLSDLLQNPALDISDDLRSGLISSFSMSPEMFGGAKGTESLENIFLNTNFFELLEERLKDPDSGGLIDLMEARGTHTAQVDAMLNAYVSDFINTGELHIRRLPTAGMPPSGLSAAAANEYTERAKDLEELFKTHGFMKENRSMTAFEQFMRARIRRSSAVTPITNVSDVSRMSDNVFKFLKTEAGSEKISLSVDSNYLQRLKNAGIDLGINLADPQNELNAAGRIFYDKREQKFAFSNFEAVGVGEDATEGISKGYQKLDTDLVRRAFNFTLDEAKGKNTVQIPILDSGRSVTVNTAKEALANISLTEIEATELDQMMAARGALGALGRPTSLSTNASALSQALGTTAEFYGQADGSFMPAHVGTKTTEYSQALINRGLPYATIDVRSRILAAAEAKATSGIGAAAINILSSAGDDTYRSLSGVEAASKVGKLSDIGLQFAISQGKERSFNLQYLGKNQELKNITDVNSYFRTPVTDISGQTTKASRVIMSGDDINQLVIRQFNKDGEITSAIQFGSEQFIEDADLNRFIDSKVQSNEINATINRAFAPRNLARETTEDLAEQVLTLNTRAYNQLTGSTRPAPVLTSEAIALAQNIFGFTSGSSAEQTQRLEQLAEMAQLSTRAERIQKLASFGADEAESKRFVDNYGKTVGSIANRIEETYITGFKISGKDAVEQISAARLAQGISSENTDVALQGRTSRLVSTLKTETEGVIAAIFSPSTTDDVDRGVRNLTGETLGVGAARAAEDRRALASFTESASLIDDITEALPGATDESRFVSDAIAKGRGLYSANKGKFALGALALAGTVTGYKMAKRGNENDLYDATMGPAPVEQGQRPYGIQEALMGNGQTSRRRDPLFTAGVVGNLDRQKIGHTSMGSNKHNHLFGDR
jgi:hypothetical protein